MRQLFIGGLYYRTTDESLWTYFDQFGEVVDAHVKINPKNGKSRGFGFVTFSHGYMVDEAQKYRPHIVRNLFYFLYYR